MSTPQNTQQEERRKVFDKEAYKEVVKEAFKEWLDEKAAAFGKWTIKWIATAAFGCVVFFLVTHGWLK